MEITDSINVTEEAKLCKCSFNFQHTPLKISKIKTDHGSPDIVVEKAKSMVRLKKMNIGFENNSPQPGLMIPDYSLSGLLHNYDDTFQ